MSDNTTVKTIKDVDKLFSEIVVNGQTNVSDRYSPQPEQQIVRQTQVIDTPSESAVTPPAPQQTEPVEGQKVHTVDLNNVLHPLQDLDLETETTQRTEADTCLQSQINTISSGLSAETTARQDADLNLSRTLSSVQNALVAETAQRQWADNTLQSNINAEATARCNADATLQGNINAEALARCNADGVLQCNIDAEATARCNADSTLQCNIDTETARINGIEELIPSQASCSNQLADKSFVNSSIATNTANFLGTYTSMAQIEAIQNPTNNDYVFLQTTDAQGNTVYERYKYSSEADDWLYEYTLNNSSFTAEQWATINSGLTQSSVNADICCAVSDEATARDTAICCAVSDEVTARNTAIGNAINALDVACAGGSGKYIQSVSQTDGKICATEGTIDSVVTSGSGNPVSSGAVATALSSVVVTDAVSAQYLKTEVDGVTYKVDNCGGNTLNIQGASGYSWINYYGGASVLKISTGDGTGCLGTVEASAFCGTLYGNASRAVRASGGSWISARDNTVITQSQQTQIEGSSWNPAVGVKTWSGFWSFGTVGGESLMLSYDTDYNYSIGNNSSAVICFPPAGSSGRLALTSDNVASADYATSAGNADTVDGYHANVSASASTIPVRDSNNHVWFGWINSANASENIGIYSNPHLVFQGDGDGFLRRTPVACVSVGYATSAGQTQFANFTNNLCNDYASMIDNTRYLKSRSFFWAYGTPRNSVWSDIVNFVGGWHSDSQYPLNWGMMVASNGRILTACSLWFDPNGVDIHIDDRGNGNLQLISCNTTEGICYGIYMTITKPQYAG